MTEVLEKAGDYRLVVLLDEYAGNPRTEYDQLCYVVTVPDRRYYDVDADGGPLAAGWRRLLYRYYWERSVEIFTRWARIFHRAVTLYDSPNEGANAVWYLLPDQARETTDPEHLLHAERDEYRAWADGSVYAYAIEHRVTWRRTDGAEGEMATWETVDSCFGFYGHEYAQEAGRAAWVAMADERGEA